MSNGLNLNTWTSSNQFVHSLTPRVICRWYSVNNLNQQMHSTILGAVLQWFVKDWNYSINYLLQIVYAALDHSWVDLILPSLAPVFANGAKDNQRRALLLKTSAKGSKIIFIQSTWSLVQLLAQECTCKPEPAGPSKSKNCTSCCIWPLKLLYSVFHESCWSFFCFRSKC